tara:strand:- start:951 stop:1331 length:381 start_codon:yes stop_codon:yes gene_type:complete
MEKGEIDIIISGPKAEMKALYQQLEADQPFEEMEIDLTDDTIDITGGYARGTDEMIEAWTKKGWNVYYNAYVFGWGPQSLHRFDGKEWHDYDFEDIDLKDMDPICEDLVCRYGVEDYIEELQEDMA